MKRYLSTLLAAALVTFFASSLRATSIEIGNGNSGNVIPWDNGYSGEYQQIYLSSALAAQPFTITSIAFETASGLSQIQPSSGSYNFTLSLGVTNRTPSNPGSSFSGTFTPVFSGPLTVTFTPAGNTFDFVVNLTTPFVYNPSVGNLLMDVMINSPNSTSPGGAVYSAATGDPNVGKVFNTGIGGVAIGEPNVGLDTLFTGSAVSSSVPDTSDSVLLLALALAGLLSARHFRSFAPARLKAL